jgi:hypothetical protein
MLLRRKPGCHDETHVLLTFSDPLNAAKQARGRQATATSFFCALGYVGKRVCCVSGATARSPKSQGL